MTQNMTTSRWPVYLAGTDQLVAHHVRIDPGKKFTWEDTLGNSRLPEGVTQNDLALYKNNVDGEVIVVVEGEKDADNLGKIGIAAWSTFGASVIPSDEALIPLTKKLEVILWPDNDGAGRRLMSQISASLVRLGQRNVRVVTWDGPDKSDASDAIEVLGEDKVFELLAKAPKVGPVTTKDGSTYHIKWVGQPITAEIKSVDHKGPHEIKAQVAVYLQGESVHRSSPTLTSTSGMESFRRSLRQNHDDRAESFSWAKIVEQLAAEIIDMHTSGNASVNIYEVTVPEGVEWKVENILVQGQPTVIWGHGSTGKSMFAQALGIWISHGLVDTSNELIIQKGNVLYLDYETDQNSVIRRMNKLEESLGQVPRGVLRYRRCFPPMSRDLEFLRDEIAEHSIDTVIVDSLGYAVGGELESPAPIIDFFSALAQLECTALVLSHPNKEGKLFGSNYIYQSARSIWKLSGESKSSVDTSKVSFTLTHEKGNDIPIQPAQGWEVHFSDNGYALSRVPVIETEGATLLPYKDLVYEVIKRESGTFEDSMVPRRMIDTAIVDIKSDGEDEDADAKVIRNVATALSRLTKEGSLIKESRAGEVKYGIIHRIGDRCSEGTNTSSGLGEWGDL